jgi:hypothetical protein
VTTSIVLDHYGAAWRLRRARCLVWATNLPPISCGPLARPRLCPPTQSWRGCKDPLSLFIGGVAAAIMELAEPRVRTGVWEHTTFRIDPIRRLRRTGLAAMVTVYGARGTAQAMIARIRQMHDRIAGSTPAGKAYRANGASTSEAALEMRFEAMANQLERAGILFEFLAIMAAPPSTAIAEWAPSTTEDRSAAARDCEACVDRDGPTRSASATAANGASLTGGER